MSERNNAGSYFFGQFTANEAELDRLKKQATAALGIERKAWELLGLGPGMNVLDVACGPGIVACELACFVRPGMVTGVDLSEQLVADARKQAQERGITNIAFQQGNVYDLNVAQTSFDFAYARFLFQHLAEPGKALENIYRALKPGGVACLVDVDDDWLMLYPEPGCFRTFVRAAAQGQAARGGDRYVGRKLGTYLQNAGFTSVKTDVIVVTTDQIGRGTFFDLTTGFKREQVTAIPRDEVEAYLREIEEALRADRAWGAAAVFIASGTKPGAGK